MSEIPVPSEADNAGRDHHPVAFSMFMEGGALKPDQTLGKTDEARASSLKCHAHRSRFCGRLRQARRCGYRCVRDVIFYVGDSAGGFHGGPAQ